MIGIHVFSDMEVMRFLVKAAFWPFFYFLKCKK